MALSQWDLDNLSADDQKKVLKYQSIWQSDPNQRDSVAAAADNIRAKYGYSGGADGSQYIPIEGFIPPTAPTIPEYQSPFANEINDIMSQLRNPPKFESPYAGLINHQISQIMSRPKFNYNPDTDPAYQAFLQRATRAGDKAYADNLGGLSAMTGGRPNSWAGTVASQARNQYLLEAQEAVIQFEDRAYSRYRDETSDMYNLVNLLNSQDEIAYSRFRDRIGDTKDLADMVLKLEDRDFEQYKYMSDQQWKVFDTEYQSYMDALTFKKEKINEAIDRTNLLGYVNNQDSITLGVPTGTLSQGARERAEVMADYIRKQELDIKQFRQEKEISHEFDLKLIKAREKSDLKLINARSSSSNSNSASFAPSPTEANKINSEYSSFDKLVKSKDFQRMSSKQKHDSIAEFLDRLINDMEKKMFGKNSDQVGQEILSRVMSSTEYQQYYEGYKQVPQVFEEIKDISKPGHSMNDFMINKYIQRGGK